MNLSASAVRSPSRRRSADEYTIEVMRYVDAPWAPRAPGAKFDWAWRVLNADGVQRIAGVATGKESEAQLRAENAISRMSTPFLYGYMAPATVKTLSRKKVSAIRPIRRAELEEEELMEGIEA